MSHTSQGMGRIFFFFSLLLPIEHSASDGISYSRLHEGFSFSCSLHQNTPQLGSQLPWNKEAQTIPYGEWKNHTIEVYMKRNAGPLMKAQNQPPDIE